MSIILDLDNTLYDQRQHLKIIFEKVGEYIERRFGIKKDKIVEFLEDEIKRGGLVNPIYTNLIKSFNLPNDCLEDILFIHRYTKPKDLKLYPSAKWFLEKIRNLKTKKILVTEGMEEIQKEKIKILRIKKYFDEICIIRTKKEKCFFEVLKKLRNKKEVDIYIGDNIFFEFYYPNILGYYTIRVLLGLYSNISNRVVPEVYRPKYTSKSFKKIYKKIKELLNKI